MQHNRHATAVPARPQDHSSAVIKPRRGSARRRGGLPEADVRVLRWTAGRPRGDQSINPPPAQIDSNTTSDSPILRARTHRGECQMPEAKPRRIDDRALVSELFPTV